MEDNKNNKKASDYIEFYMGIILMIAGVFFLLSKAVVHSGFYGWNVFGGVNISSGIIIIPLMLGIVWLVNNPKSIIARLITIAGFIFIIGSIIMNIRISFTTTSMFDYVIMMLLIAAGVGLLLKAIFLARK